MKLIRVGLMSAVMVVMMCCGVFAQQTFYPQGSITVPAVANWGSSNNYTTTNYILTNVTDNIVQCKVTVFDHDGNDVTHFCRVYTGGVGSQAVLLSSGAGEFSIPEHSTRRVCFVITNSVSGVYGNAKIEWMSDDSNQRNALVGEMWRFAILSSGPHSFGYLVNNGQPF